MSYSPIINKISATCFGVLLIHANGDAMRRWLWKDVLNNVGMYDSDLLVLHAILSVLGVFAICSIIDTLRIKLIETPLFNYFDNPNNKFFLYLKRKND